MKKLLQEILSNWPTNPKRSAERLFDYYGKPTEISESYIIWKDCKPWKRTVLTKNEIPHNFPHPHTDYLEQFIDYRVPLDFYDDLAVFDGSIIVQRTKGEISARCGGTSMNFVAINLAHDIIIGKCTISEARSKYNELYLAYKDGEKPSYTQKFKFVLDKIDTKDPDVEIIRNPEKRLYSA